MLKSFKVQSEMSKETEFLSKSIRLLNEQPFDSRISIKSISARAILRAVPKKLNHLEYSTE